ncbi:T4 gp25-like baseplate wedge protein [Haloarcula tailed virus 2]|uniref:T4 gp25-like baseplate wedge protein n=1 Tax=Haloarcula tailed virus 2 TaxID=2877989 RepID=A0AAE9BZ95_9CAUD|nr:T4 gp25-like baseplate wedge protein [Haloarcula tailed virus 2]UBF23178.1 T4 gp25-like baseplate wedge protein [Haloarcula tailed virus 2]
MVDTFRDALIDRDRDIVVESGDIILTQDREENIAQSVSIGAGDVIRDLIGGQLTAQIVENARTQIAERLRDDVQIEDVVSATITEINKAEGSVTIRVVLRSDPDFEIEVQA